jgi:hypothetical protein
MQDGTQAELIPWTAPARRPSGLLPVILNGERKMLAALQRHGRTRPIGQQPTLDSSTTPISPFGSLWFINSCRHELSGRPHQRAPGRPTSG